MVEMGGRSLRESATHPTAKVRGCDARFDENRESWVRGDEGKLDTIARCRPYLQYNDFFLHSSVKCPD